MGLESEVWDVSSESPLIRAIALVARASTYLQSFLLTALHSSLRLLHFSNSSSTHHHHNHNHNHATGVGSGLGSGLASLILLCDQLNINRSTTSETSATDGYGDGDCVVCLNPMIEGESLRRLPCRHIFHNDCFQGWLEHLNFTCPLCRAHLLSDDHVATTHRRVEEDLLSWQWPTITTRF